MERVAMILLGALAMLAASAASPEITFKNLEHDFGNIREDGGKVACTFTYTNTGDAPLALATVSAPCSCTGSEFSAKPLAPGKSADIKITFNPAGMSGEFMRTIRVRTNIKQPDGKKKIVNLKISGAVIPSK